MKFDIIIRTKTLFAEIVNFYACWNIGPEYVLPYILDQPSTAQKIDAFETERNKALMARPKPIKFVPTLFRTHQKESLRYFVDCLSMAMPDSYQLAGLDVQRYLYFDRIVPLRDEVFTTFCNEWDAVDNDAQERSQIRWRQKFRSQLNTLSNQLMILASTPLESRPKPDGYGEWTNDYGNVRWYDIDQTLRDLANNHIRPLIEQYTNFFEDNSSDLPKPKLSSTSESLPAKELPPSGFESYIVEQYRIKLMPYLIKHYTGRKPKDLVPMLYALEQSNLTVGNIITYDQTELHKALKCTFGDVGQRTSLCDALHKYDQDTAKPNPNPNYKIKIDRHQLNLDTIIKTAESN